MRYTLIKCFILMMNIFFNIVISMEEGHTNEHDNIDGTEKMKKEIEKLFKEMDFNKDNKIERDELHSDFIVSMRNLHEDTTNEEFYKVNTDRDNFVSLDEYFTYKYKDVPSDIKKFTISKTTGSSKLRKENQSIKDQFTAADHDNNHYLDIHEYIYFKYPLFFPHVTNVFIQNLIDDIDTNDDGLLDRKEYINSLIKTDFKNEETKKKFIKTAEYNFLIYDADSNKRINANEYRGLLKLGYEEPANSLAEYFFNENDLNNDRILTFEEINTNAALWLNSIMVHIHKKNPSSHYFKDEL